MRPQNKRQLEQYFDNLSDDITHHLDNVPSMNDWDRLVESGMMIAIGLRLIAIAIENQS